MTTADRRPFLRVRGSARGIALIAVLLSTILLLALVTVLVDLGTIRLQRATADLRGVQALGGADAGTAWVRAVLDQQHGDLTAVSAKLALTQGRRRFTIDDQTYAVATVTLQQAPSQYQQGDHLDDNVQQNPSATEQIVQITSSAALYAYGDVVARRVTGTLVRVFPAPPYSEVVGYIDDASAVGIDSPGDAAGQVGATDTTELLVHAYVMDRVSSPQNADVFNNASWSDNNTSGPGPLP